MNRTQTRFIVQHLLQICCAIVCRNCAHCSCVYNGFLSVDITHRILPSAPSVFHLFHVPSVSYGDPPSASHLFPFLSIPRGVFLVLSSFSFFLLVPHGAFHVFHLPSVFYGDVPCGDVCPSAFHSFLSFSFFLFLSVLHDALPSSFQVFLSFSFFLLVPHGAFHVFHLPSVSYDDGPYGDVCLSFFHLFLSLSFFLFLLVLHGAFHVFHLPSVSYDDDPYGDVCPSFFHLFLSFSLFLFLSVLHGALPSAFQVFLSFSFFLSVPRGAFHVFHLLSVSYGDGPYGDVCPFNFYTFNSYPLGQNGRNFTDYIFKHIFFNENVSFRFKCH